MKKISLILLFAILVSACATAPTAGSFTADPEQLAAEIDALVEENHQNGVFDGAILVARDGKVILSKGYGFADRIEDIPNTPQTKFRIASITKQFTAMAILLLQEQGKLKIDDSICDHITGCPEIFEPVTIRHLLSQSAGLPNNTAYSVPGEQMVNKFATLLFTPGEEFKYQDVTYNVAGRIIETVSGQSYADFLDENIFKPLGMVNSGVASLEHDGLASGYSDAVGDNRLQPMFTYAEGSIYSTVEDMYLWDQALSTDQLVSQASIEEMFAAQIEVPDGEFYGFDGSTGWGYGFGWFIAPEEYGYVLHGGTLPGFRSEIRRYMDDRVTIIQLCNHEAVWLYPTAEEIEDLILGE